MKKQQLIKILNKSCHKDAELIFYEHNPKTNIRTDYEIASIDEGHLLKEIYIKIIKLRRF